MSGSFSLKRLFPIASDPTIMVLVVMIIILAFFTVQMVNNDVNSPYNTTKFINKTLSTEPLQITNHFNVPSITDLSVLPEKSSEYTNSTKIITQWTEIPREGYEDCTQYGSGWGGNGPNSSTWGRCYNCSCIEMQEIDIP